MSTKRGGGSSSQKAESQSKHSTEKTTSQEQEEQHLASSSEEPYSQPNTPTRQSSEPQGEGDKKPAARRDQPSDSTSPSTPDDPISRQQQQQEQHTETPARQVIAVSASKGPAAFFNLARKFLVTDEECDLSALEGAIVSAVDAAHLLERSKLATIERVQTSYVTVEPKRRKQLPSPGTQPQPSPPGAIPSVAIGSSPAGQQQQHIPASQQYPATAAGGSEAPARSRQGGSSSRELRRARIVITVRRTESYKQWLLENPLQAIIGGDVGDEVDDDAAGERDVAAPVGGDHRRREHEQHKQQAHQGR